LLRGRLPRNWLPRFRGTLGLNRHHLSIVRINRLYFRLDGVLLLPLGGRLEATVLLLALGGRLEATVLLLALGGRLEATILLLALGGRLEAAILLLDGVLLPAGATLLLVGTDDPAISVDGAALARAPATNRGASTRAVSSSS
jgi:hypothetical protein